MHYYLIAGESSGDLHGYNLMKSIKQLDASSEFRFCGGDLMLEESPNINIHCKEMAFMGFVEVLQNLGKIKKNFKKVEADILEYRPDAIILIDYPGFNLRIAKFAHNFGITVHYYISPKVWAWKSSRIKKIKAWVDNLMVILPFEEEFFKQHDYKVSYVGNPLLDAIHEFKSEFNNHPQQLLGFPLPVLAILPGSRKMEIEKILPNLLLAASKINNVMPVIAGVNSLPKDLYDKINTYNFPIVYGQTYQLLSEAKVALVTSGTATLETALFNVPQVVCYKAHPISIWLAKKLVKIKFISLVNLIMDKEVVKELIQQKGR